MPNNPIQKYTSGYLYYVTATVEDLEDADISESSYDDDEDQGSNYSHVSEDLTTMFPTRLVTRLDGEEEHTSEEWLQVDFTQAVEAGEEMYVCVAVYRADDHSLESCVDLVTADMDEANNWSDKLEEEDHRIDCVSDATAVAYQVYNLTLR